MRLPRLSIIIAGLFVVWCVAGVWVHDWTILLYPLAWLAIVSAFLIHNALYPIAGKTTSALEDIEPVDAARKNAHSDKKAHKQVPVVAD